MKRALVVLALVGCDKILLGPERLDASIDPLDIANLPFGPPMPIASVNTDADEDRPTLTADLLELYFHRTEVTTRSRIWVAKRARVDDPFGPPEIVTKLDIGNVARACVSSDGLRIYFSHVPSIADYGDIYFASRATRADDWSTPTVVPELTTVAKEFCGSERSDRLVMLGMSDSGGTTFDDTWMVSRTSQDLPWGPRAPIAELNTVDEEGAPWADASGVILVFDRRKTGSSEVAIFQATLQGQTYAVRKLTELEQDGRQGSPWVSPDGRTLVYAVGDTRGDVFMATR